MYYDMCIHNYLFPVIYLGVIILKKLGFEQDDAEPTDRLQRALLCYEEERSRGQNLHIEKFIVFCHLKTCSVTMDRLSM
jgi:hypothetical protein